MNDELFYSDCTIDSGIYTYTIKSNEYYKYKNCNNSLRFYLDYRE